MADILTAESEGVLTPQEKKRRIDGIIRRFLECLASGPDEEIANFAQRKLDDLILDAEEIDG